MHTEYVDATIKAPNTETEMLGINFTTFTGNDNKFWVLRGEAKDQVSLRSGERVKVKISEEQMLGEVKTVFSAPDVRPTITIAGTNPRN